MLEALTTRVDVSEKRHRYRLGSLAAMYHPAARW
jgi:hypothetical protein